MTTENASVPFLLLHVLFYLARGGLLCQSLTLVVILLALAKTKLHLDEIALKIDRQRDKRQSVLLYLACIPDA